MILPRGLVDCYHIYIFIYIMINGFLNHNNSFRFYFAKNRIGHRYIHLQSGSMNIFTEVNDKTKSFQINHLSKLLFIGSCFSEHISSELVRLKFPVIANPQVI